MESRKLIEEHNYKGKILQIFEEGYHYVFYINGQRVFSNTDLEYIL